MLGVRSTGNEVRNEKRWPKIKPADTEVNLLTMTTMIFRRRFLRMVGKTHVYIASAEISIKTRVQILFQKVNIHTHTITYSQKERGRSTCSAARKWQSVACPKRFWRRSAWIEVLATLAYTCPVPRAKLKAFLLLCSPFQNVSNPGSLQTVYFSIIGCEWHIWCYLEGTSFSWLMLAAFRQVRR